MKYAVRALDEHKTWLYSNTGILLSKSEIFRRDNFDDYVFDKTEAFLLYKELVRHRSWQFGAIALVTGVIKGSNFVEYNVVDYWESKTA